MNVFGRIFRQLFFGLLFLALLGGSGYAAYKKFFPVLPDCHDGIKNQDEKGIDCEGICEAACPLPTPPPETVEIRIEWAKAASSGMDTYDLAAKIINPNKYWGLENFKYEFIVKNKNGEVVLTKEGQSYLLPDDYDYIIAVSQKTDGSAEDVELKISDEKWASVNENYGISSLSLPIRDKQYTARDENTFPSASGILTNNTPYDFDKIDIKIVLFGDDGDLAAVNTSDMQTMLAGEERYFRSIWSAAPQKAVLQPDFKATANIFNSKNFMRRYGAEDRSEPYR